MASEPSAKTEEIKVAGGSGRALALVPILVAILSFALMIPRSAVPEAIPVPVVDGRVIAQVAARDRALADKVKSEPLPGVVRALGSVLREFNMKQAEDADELTLTAIRGRLNDALVAAVSEGSDKLIALRAVQVEAFLEEVRKFERTGEESEELHALGGGFVRRLRFSGWCTGHTIVLDEDERRVAFKAAWNGALGLDANPDFAPTLDETRVLYTLYIQHPHAPESARDKIEAARRDNPDAKTCAELLNHERQATESWRLDKIKKLATLDPTYPTDYAVGVAEFRRGQMAAANTAFRAWLGQHPDGPYSLRARNYLKATVELVGY